jgi:small-conductance mechanosensitive channel
VEATLREWLDNPTVVRALVAVGGIILVIVVVRLVQGSVGRSVKGSETRYRIRQVVKFLGYLAAFLVITTVYANRLSGFTVALGVAGAGVAFALQEVIASVAGWAAVSFGGFYDPGDRVQLGGIRGDVIDIGILRTTLMECGDWVDGDLYNGRIVRVANSFVFKEPVFNYSGEFPFLWDEIKVPISHGSDRALTHQLLEHIADEVAGDYADFAEKGWKDLVRRYLIEDARVQPMVTYTVNENWITYVVRYPVDYRKRRVTKHEMFKRVMDGIDASGDEIRLAYSTLAITGMPPIEVHGPENR